MTILDWIIVGFALLFALLGSRQGFVVGLLSLAGFAGGAVAGSRLAPLLLREGSSSPYSPLFALGGAVIGGVLLAGGFEGVARGLRGRIRATRGLSGLDSGFGALLAAALALGLVWIAASAALQTPGHPELRRGVQRSLVLRTLNDLLPPSGTILHALARFDPLPALRGPSADVAPPRAAIARSPQVQAAAGSVVRVLGTACGLGIEGSGWVAGGGLVVTNAHVVAGEQDTTVQLRGVGARLPARAVAFDALNDVAVLRVSGLTAPALAVASDPAAGTAAAVLGFPDNGAFELRAARIGSTVSAISQDAYGNGPVTRLLTPLRGSVRHGDSGGPVVDARGRVVATVFAATVSTRRPGGYGVPNAVVRGVLARAAEPVSTGPCAR